MIQVIRAQQGNIIVDFITDGNIHIVNEIKGSTIIRKEVSISMGNRLYACCKSLGYEIATWVDGQKVSKNPTTAFKKEDKIMVGTTCSSVISDALKAARKDACKAINDFKDYPRVYPEFAAKAKELKDAINAAETVIEINKIMRQAHAKDRWDLA